MPPTRHCVPLVPPPVVSSPSALNAVASVTGDRCEVWAPTQNPQAAKALVAQVLGFDPNDVTLHVTLLGGAFGRKSKPDYVAEAAVLCPSFYRADVVSNPSWWDRTLFRARRAFIGALGTSSPSPQGREGGVRGLGPLSESSVDSRTPSPQPSPPRGEGVRMSQRRA